MSLRFVIAARGYRAGPSRPYARRIDIARTRRRDHLDVGAGLLGLLMVLLILGGIAGVAVASVSGSATVPSLTIPTTSLAVRGSTTTTTSPSGSGGPGGPAREALVAACVANVDTLDAAIQAYEAVHGGLPPAGRAWSHGLLQSWPSSDEYALAWTGASVVVTPARGTPSSGSAGSASLRTGCYAA